MILYLDASALVKRYVAERGSEEVAAVIAAAAVSGTAVISRAETAAALAKAVRLGVLAQDGAAAALARLQEDWPRLVRLQVTESLIARAAGLAWAHGLRGYDAVHLAAAVIWQEAMGRQVTIATFDRTLWQVAGQVGLIPFPERV